MSKLTEALAAGRPILMDGAMGTELMRAGVKPGPGVNVAEPQIVRGIHASYIAAGARVLLTNTFQATGQTRGQAVSAAVRIAMVTVRAGDFVFGSLGPAPAQNRRFMELGLLDGVDALLLETRSYVPPMETFAKLVQRKLPGVAVLVSLAFRRDVRGRLETEYGSGPETVASEAEREGVAALGVNCGRDISLADTTTILQAYRSVCKLPLFARPNAGTPTRVGDCLVYPVTPADMAAWVPDAVHAGAIMIGGCCGTTPEHIAACRAALAKLDS